MIFQIEHDLVKKARRQDNFEIVEVSKERRCVAVYFSSNDLYYPNDSDAFTKAILEKNRYEWFGTRVLRADKHIFVRDVFKQWYLKGISSEIGSPQLLQQFLKKNIEDYQETLFLGSSAGGFAAIFYGNILGVNKVYAFNAQIELASLVTKTEYSVNPLIHDAFLENSKAPELNALSFHNRTVETIYIFSYLSNWDREQSTHAHNIRKLKFYSFKHGIPFAKELLPKIINGNMNVFFPKNKPEFPIIFNLKIGGLGVVYREYFRILKKLIKG